MQIIQHIKLNIYQRSDYTYLDAKQADDNSRFLNVQFTDGENDIFVTAGVTVTLRCQKPDGTAVYNNGTRESDGTVTVELTDQVLAVPGIVYADISTSRNGEILSSATFIIRVIPVPTGTQIVSTNEFLQLTELIEELEQLDVVQLQQDIDGLADSIALEYSSSSTYGVGDYAIYDGYLYRCTTAITTAEAWNASHWVQIKLANDTGTALGIGEHLVNGIKVFNTSSGLPTVNIGNINPSTGADTTTPTNRCRTDFAAVASKVFRVYVDPNYLVAPFFYYLASGGSRTYLGYQVWRDTNAPTITSNLDYNLVKLTFKRLDDAEMTSDDVDAIANSLKIYLPTDTSLTQAGVPADAKTVGDILTSNIAYYNGLKYAALGDSITYGFIPRNYTGYPGQLSSFAQLTADKFGMTFANYGISGSTMAYHASRNPMSRRWQNLPDDADLISVMGGTNDIRNGIQLGTMADRTDATYYGALHVVLGGLYKKYMIDQGVEVGKTKKIVALTPIKLLQTSSQTQGGTGTLYDFEPWCDAVKEVAAYYSIPCLDFYNLSGINPHLNETIHGWQEEYTGYYNPYITDGTHPTQEGAELMANCFMGFLRTI